MKNTLFLSSLMALLVSSSLSAAVYSVDSATSFASAWNNLASGDSILVTDDIDMSTVGTLATHAYKVEIQSENGSMLSWAGAGGSSPLPAEVEYQGLTIASAPAVVLTGGDVTVGEGNTFSSNNNGVIAANGAVVVLENNVFDSNYTASDGAAIKVVDDGTLVVNGGCEFRNNMAAGRGGAIILSDAAAASGSWSAILDATNADIVFEGNAENVVISGGSIVDPGFANDVYVGANRTVQMLVGKDNMIALSSGLASADSSAIVEKTGAGDLLVGDAEFYSGALNVCEGRVVLAENRSWGDGSSSAMISVDSAGAFVLNNGSTLSQNIDMKGGALEVRQGAVLNSTLTASSASVITFQLTPEAVQLPSVATTPWLTIAPGGSISTASAANLTLNLDVSAFDKAVEAAGLLFAVDFSNAGDADTPQAIQTLTITYTDAKGVHSSDLTINEDGMLDISAILAAMACDNVQVLGTNSMLSSMGTLNWLSDASRSAVPNMASIKSASRIWGTAMGGSINHSGKSSDYDYSGGGYAIGADTQVAENTYVGITFGQAFGSGDAGNASVTDASSSVDQTAVMLGVYGRYLYTINPSQELMFDAFAGYSSVDNEMKCAQGRADWRDDVLTCSARVIWQLQLDGGLRLSPFFALEYSSVSQADYSVGGNVYSGGKASLFSMPVGVTISNRITECEQKAITPYISAAFVPHLAKDNPEADVTNAYGRTAKSKGIEFENCSFRIQGGIRVEWDDQWTTDINARIQTDSSQSSWHVGVSASYVF